MDTVGHPGRRLGLRVRFPPAQDGILVLVGSTPTPRSITPHSLAVDMDINRLLREAAKQEMSTDDLFEQRVSFVYGQLGGDNLLTKDDVRERLRRHLLIRDVIDRHRDVLVALKDR